MKSNKRKSRAVIIIFAIICLFFQPTSDTIIHSLKSENQGDLRYSALISNTTQWINNSGFDSYLGYWYNETIGDATDFNVSISDGSAKFITLGDKREFSDINGTPSDLDWFPEKKPGLSIFPDRYNISQYGCNASHEYWEDASSDNIYGVRGNQTRNRPTVLWKRIVKIPVDMSDYVITSANLTVVFNATANTNVETPNDSLSGTNPTAAEYDHVKFYVQLSDLEDKVRYPAASYEPRNLGFGDLPADQNQPSDGIVHNITDTQLIPVPEEVLVFYLNRILEYDHRNFTIFLGIDIDVEDNYGEYDRDTYYSLLIKTCNLTFTYEKTIDEFTSVSLKQDGRKLSSLTNLSSYQVKATEAKLNFQYKIDKNWTVYTSDHNSEINIYLNGNPYPIPLKVKDFNITSFEEIDLDLVPPTDSVNLSIELLLRDSFELDQHITFSFDNVTLNISYIIFPIAITPIGDDGGGGTKVIRTPDNIPLVIGLTIGAVALVSILGAYQFHYKYPPMIRKIKKLKKKVRKGKKTKPLLLNTREEIIKNSFKRLEIVTKPSELIENKSITKQVKYK